MSSPLTSSVDEFSFTLEAAAEHAASARGVLRAWFADDDVFAEVYFFRDFVIHVEVNGTHGLPAIGDAG